MTVTRSAQGDRNLICPHATNQPKKCTYILEKMSVHFLKDVDTFFGKCIDILLVTLLEGEILGRQAVTLPPPPHTFYEIGKHNN